jgi:hypothetical protein
MWRFDGKRKGKVKNNLKHRNAGKGEVDLHAHVCLSPICVIIPSSLPCANAFISNRFDCCLLIITEERRGSNIYLHGQSRSIASQVSLCLHKILTVFFLFVHPFLSFSFSPPPSPSPHFDMTMRNLNRIFGTFDRDANGRVSYKGFRKGLALMGIDFLEEEEFQSLVKTIDDDQSGDVTL